jgi:hypothetical protein
MKKFLHNLVLFCVKNANFLAKFFGENIFKIITSVFEIKVCSGAAKSDISWVVWLLKHFYILHTQTS